MPDPFQPSPPLLWIGSIALLAAGAAVATRRGPGPLRWLLILAGAQALWISYLARPDLGIDGGLSLTLALLPPREMAAINARDVHPPAYYALLHGWIGAAGLSPFATRYLTVIAAIGAVAAVGAAGRRLGGVRAGEIAGLAVALTPGVALLATTVRDFAPGLGLAGLAVFLWLGLACPPKLARGRADSGGGRLLSRIRLPGGAWLLGLCFGAGLWTTYLFGVVMVATGAASLLWGRRALGAWARAAVLGTALFLPWLIYEVPFFLERSASGQTARTAGVTPEDPLYFLGEATLALAGSGRGPLPGPIEWAALIGLAAFCVVLAGAAWRGPARDRRPVAVGAVGGVLMLAGSYLLMRTWANITAVERYAIYATPFLAPALGFALTFPFPVRARAVRLVGWTLAAVVALSGLAWSRHLITDRYQPGPGWDPVATMAAIDRLAAPDAAVVFVSLEQPSYYQALSARPLPWAVVPVLPSYVAGDIAANAARAIDPLVARYPIIWVVAYLHGFPGTDQVLDRLRDRAFPSHQEITPDSTLYAFVSPRADAIDRPISAAFQDGIDLTGAAFPAEAAPGGGLPVALTWSARARPAGDYTLFVHLVTPDQTRRIAGNDSRPFGGRGSTSLWQPGESLTDPHGLLLPADTPPGDYLLVAGLYAGDTRLQTVDGRTQVILGPVRIADPASR